MRNIIGISRSPRFSPNSEGRDNATFSMVCEKLEQQGYQVLRIEEDDVLTMNVEALLSYQPEVIFTMARHEAVWEILGALEQRGVCVLNSVKALRSASRSGFYQTLSHEDLPYVESHLLSSAKYALTQYERQTEDCPTLALPCSFPLWVKRNDARSEVASDVVFVTQPSALQSAMSDFAQRGIEEVVATPHIVGDLIKFYGVEGTDFFYYYYPTAENDFSKFGLEQHNGSPQGFPLDAVRFQSVANQIAHVTGLVIYGGDAVLTKDGDIIVIDFNDFPSFSRCRDEATDAIMKRVLQSAMITKVTN